MYTDPPWGPGMMKYFRTLNSEVSREDQLDWGKLLRKLKELADVFVNGPVFIEMGIRFREDVEEVFGKPRAVYFPKYGKDLTNLLMVYGTHPIVSLDGAKGVSLVYGALKDLRPRSVFDPFIGLGITARACKRLGAVCIGAELNQKRLAETAKILPFEVIP